VWVLPRWLRAVTTGTNLLNPLHAWPNRPTYELRLGKYAARGFPIAIPALDMQRVDGLRIRRAQLSELHGMARLLKVAFEMEAPPAAPCHGRGANFPKDTPFRLAVLQRPKFPKDCSLLKESYKEDLTEDERLVASCNTGCNYFRRGSVGEEDLPGISNERGYGAGPHGVLVPSAFAGVEPADYWNSRGGDVPFASEEIRASVWDEIADFPGEQVEGIPRRLVDSWDDGKRSREYLNAETDQITLNAQYYTHAYMND